MLCLLGFQLADVLSGGDAHFLFEDPAEIEGIPVTRKGGDVLNGGDALLHQFTGPLDPEGLEILTEADVQAFPKKIGKVFGRVGEPATDGFQCKLRIGTVFVQILLDGSQRGNGRLLFRKEVGT